MIPCIFFDSIFVVVLNAVAEAQAASNVCPAQPGDMTFLSSDLESQ
jgi:hypothetical protein